MFFKKKTNNEAQMLLLQTAETFHCCVSGRFYTELPQLEDALNWGRQHAVNHVILAQNEDVYALNVQVPSQEIADRIPALLYEAASLSHHEQDDILISTLPASTLPGIRHADIASVFEINALKTLSHEVSRMKGHLTGMTSIQQLLLTYHFNEPSLKNKGFILFLEESAFLVLTQNGALSFRNIPFGTHEFITNPEQWETRAKRRFTQVEGMDIVIYTEKNNLHLLQKIKEILLPNSVILQSFDQILPSIFTLFANRVLPAQLPEPKGMSENLILKLIIFMIIACLGWCGYTYFQEYSETEKIKKELVEAKRIAGEIKAAEDAFKQAQNQLTAENQLLNVLKGNERIDISLVTVINLLSRYPLDQTRITRLLLEPNRNIRIEGESLNQSDMIAFLIHFEKELSAYQMKFTSKKIEKKDADTFGFTYVIEEVAK